MFISSLGKGKWKYCDLIYQTRRHYLNHPSLLTHPSFPHSSSHFITPPTSIHSSFQRRLYSNMSRSELPQQLFARNLKFSKTCSAPLLEKLSTGQSPGLFWLGCSDSRVSESRVLDAELGEVFVHRNIANVYRESDNSATAALSYAVNHLKVAHVAIVGHTSCGGCAAALGSATSRTTVPPVDHQDHCLMNWLAPVRSLAVNVVREGAQGVEALQKVVEANISAGVSNVSSGKVMREAWQRGQDVSVHGWVYNLATGVITDLNISQGLAAHVNPK